MAEYSDVIRARFLKALSDGPEAALTRGELSRHSDPDIRRLGAAAERIKEALARKDPSLLSKAMEALNALPQSSYWSALIDDAARVALSGALSIENQEPSKQAMVQAGIVIAAYASSYGFPCSDGTLALVREARREGQGAAGLADLVLRRNEAQRPQMPSGRSFGGHGAKSEPLPKKPRKAVK